MLRCTSSQVLSLCPAYDHPSSPASLLPAAVDDNTWEECAKAGLSSHTSSGQLKRRSVRCCLFFLQAAAAAAAGPRGCTAAPPTSSHSSPQQRSSVVYRRVVVPHHCRRVALGSPRSTGDRGRFPSSLSLLLLRPFRGGGSLLCWKEQLLPAAVLQAGSF